MLLAFRNKVKTLLKVFLVMFLKIDAIRSAAVDTTVINRSNTTIQVEDKDLRIGH